MKPGGIDRGVELEEKNFWEVIDKEFKENKKFEENKN